MTSCPTANEIRALTTETAQRKCSGETSVSASGLDLLFVLLLFPTALVTSSCGRQLRQTCERSAWPLKCPANTCRLRKEGGTACGLSTRLLQERIQKRSTDGALPPPPPPCPRPVSPCFNLSTKDRDPGWLHRQPLWPVNDRTENERTDHILTVPTPLEVTTLFIKNIFSELSLKSYSQVSVYTRRRPPDGRHSQQSISKLGSPCPLTSRADCAVDTNTLTRQARLTRRQDLGTDGAEAMSWLQMLLSSIGLDDGGDDYCLE
ncbi:hypothetical protein C0Q70_13503 [Pomacea canaliculata]|uniref:Uncharacterized protein n=1 Tax=Pomacea canaliculata TaxID=400727 RepID=A0A2T7NXD2_POMCA|nr:hypothetical protein C0Q70_13503 [Pomacea canaliculata]